MKLRLQFPPTPAFAPKHAALAVDVVKNVEGITLDYSPESLKSIDAIIQGFHARHLTEGQIAETIFTFGCYAGEVMVRHKRGVWADSKDVMDGKVAEMFPFMVVKLMPSGKIWNPIGKAFKELENGQEDSLEYMYQISDQP